MLDFKCAIDAYCALAEVADARFNADPDGVHIGKVLELQKNMPPPELRMQLNDPFVQSLHDRAAGHVDSHATFHITAGLPAVTDQDERLRALAHGTTDGEPWHLNLSADCSFKLMSDISSNTLACIDAEDVASRIRSTEEARFCYFNTY